MSQLGNMRAENNMLTEAVALNCQALAIRIAIGVPQAENNINRLVKLRSQLGEEQFIDAASAVFDDESMRNLQDILTQAEMVPNGNEQD